jgi:hypothetical protein
MRAFRVDLAALASNLKSGAAFGATLYWDLVLFCATWCDVDIESKSFILLSLFSAVRCRAVQGYALDSQIGLKSPLARSLYCSLFDIDH